MFCKLLAKTKKNKSNNKSFMLLFYSLRNKQDIIVERHKDFKQKKNIFCCCSDGCK